MSLVHLLANWICNPVALFVASLLLAIIFHFWKKTRLAFLFFSAGITWVLLSAASPLPQWLIHILERQYQPFSLGSQQLKAPVYILVLGGGQTQDASLPVTMRLSGNATVRLMEGIRIYKQIEGSRIIGSGASLSKRISLAEVQSLAAIELGIDSGDTLQNREPINTMEEIQAYKKRMGNEATLILVTSAFHMPRAMYLCEKMGLKVIAAPTDFYVKNDEQHWRFNFKPSPQKMEMMQRALHEYLGLLQVYFLL